MNIAYAGMNLITLANMYAAPVEELQKWAKEFSVPLTDPLTTTAASAFNAACATRANPSHTIGTFYDGSRADEPFQPDDLRYELPALRAVRDEGARKANMYSRDLGEDVMCLRRGYRIVVYRLHAEADKIEAAKREGFRASYTAYARYECKGQRYVPNANNAKWSSMSSRGNVNTRRRYTGGQKATRTYTAVPKKWSRF